MRSIRGKTNQLEFMYCFSEKLKNDTVFPHKIHVTYEFHHPHLSGNCN